MDITTTENFKDEHMELNYREYNDMQTRLDDPMITSLPKEVYNNILTTIDEVKLVNNLVSTSIRNICDTDKDDDGKVIVDLTNPHRLVNMDYFRPAALYFQKHGKYTDLTLNKHPKSPYRLFWREEKRRCKEGYIREEDGEWIPGELYFYWNYCPILLTKETKGTKKADRVREFADPWLGDYLFFHYYNQAKEVGSHVVIIKCRGIGFSFKAASFGPHRALFYKDLKTFYTAYEKTYLNEDGILNKSWEYLDFLAINTPWPRMRLTDSLNRMQIKLGYKDMADGTTKGTRGEIIGVSAKDNVGKLRGKRGMIIFEEFGKFPGVDDTWNICRPSVEDGDFAFATLISGGTGGEEGNSFVGAEKMIYAPKAFNALGIPNVYDKNSNGAEVSMHWGSYMARKGCINKDGMPDVIKALAQVLMRFYDIKMSSTDSKALTQARAENAITIQDAIMRTEGTLFPVVELKDYLEEIMPQFKKMQSTHYIGNLISKNKEVIWQPDMTLYPINTFPLQTTNSVDKKGAIEIFEKPKKNNLGEIDPMRYIAGIDPVDDDEAKYSVSLTSILVFDTFTDRIVAEYTGRPKYADDFFEICRKLMIYYNGRANYEQNKKGLFSYFSNHHSLHLLCDTPEILRDNDMAGAKGYGNKAKGSNASTSVNNWARRLIAQWLIKPAYESINEDLDDKDKVETPNLRKIRSKALLEELIKWNPEINCDRVSALGMVMIYREERLKNLDTVRSNNNNKGYSPKADDSYFD